jgi:hypothetical protein
MSDEWRVRIEADPKDVRALLRSIEGAAPSDFAGGLEARFPVSHGDGHVFIYAGSEADAKRALAELEPVLAEHGVADAVTLSRWHPIEERWEDTSLPLPQTEDEIERERTRRRELEAQRSRESGMPEWEIRITLPSRDAARELAQQLKDEGLSATRGWRHVMVGAATEDEAHERARRLRDEAPPGSLLHVEPSGAAAWRTTHPFALFGGLGG